MRFKAIVENPGSLIRMLTCLSHMAKDCLIVLCREDWKFMLNERFVAQAHPQCYATTPIAYAFSHYMLESRASENEILLQVNIRNLLAAFKSAKEFSGGLTILKLTKKNEKPLLSFEMWRDDGDELSVKVIQDVSVKPIQHSKLYLYEEPTLGQYHGSCSLPKLKSIKTVIERMRIISDSVSSEKADIYINNNDGRFLLEISTDHCRLKTIYGGLALENKHIHNQQSSNQRRNEYIKAQIELKYLLKVIQALNPLQIKQTIIAITKKTCVTVHARLTDHQHRNNRNNTNNNNNDELNEDQQDENNNGGDKLSSRVTFYLCVYLDGDDDDDSEEEDEEEDDDEQDEDEDESDDDDDDETTNNDQDMQDID